MKVYRGCIAIIAVASGTLTSYGGLLLHLVTVVSIWTLHGPIYAIPALFLPVVAEIYLFIAAGMVNPLGFGNAYTYWLAAYALVAVVHRAALVVIARWDDSPKP